MDGTERWLMERSGSLNPNADSRRRLRRRRLALRVLSILVILALVLAGVGLWVLRTLPGTAAAQISHLTNTRVKMGAFDFHGDGSVSVDGLVMCPGGQQQSGDDSDAILRAGSIRAYFSPRSLLTLSPRLTELRIEDFILDVQLDLDSGTWNIGDLRIDRSVGKPDRILPKIVLQRGKLRYSKASGGKVETVMSIPVEADFGFVTEPRKGYRFGIKTAGLSSGYGQSHLEGFWRKGELTLAGGLSSTDIPSLERAWAADVIAAQLVYDANDDYTLDLHVKNAHNKQSPEVDALRTLVPASLDESSLLSAAQAFFTRYRPSGTVGQVTLRTRGNLKRLAGSEVLGSLVCDDLSVCDRGFPYQIDHLRGELTFTQSTVVLKQLAGRHGDVELVIDGWTKGSGRDRVYQYRVTSDNMVLDAGLYAALLPGQKRLWDAFQPRGVVGVDYRLARTSPAQKREYVTVDLQHVAARYEKFPYPLEELTGELYLDNESIVASDIVSRAGGRWIQVDGRIARQEGGPWIYSVSIDGNDIPLDAVLAKSLPEQYRKLYEQFDAHGTADVRAKVFTPDDANDEEAVGFLANITARMDSLKPQRLPLMISDASADLSVTPESLNVKSLTGRYEDGTVSLAGGARLAHGGLPQVWFKATAEGMPLEDGAVDLLPEPLRQRVADFDPRGKVNLAIDVRRSDGNEPLDYTIVVECLGDRFEHARFAYPLREVRGKIAMKPGGVTFDAVEGAPAVALGRETQSTIRLNGHLDLTDGDSSLGSLVVEARSIPITSELANALSGDLRQVYRDAPPRGSFDLDLEIPRISKVSPGGRRIDFRGTAYLDINNLNIAGATELCGDVDFDGSYDVGVGFSNACATLDAEHLTVRGKTITDLQGRVVLDPNARTWSAPGFVGDCCDGRVAGNLELRQADESAWQYNLEVAFHRVDLRQFLAAGRVGAMTESDYTSGIMDAALCLGARFGDASSQLGSCRIDVADMRVGKGSPIANFLGVLQLNEPTDYTFDQMLVESYLKRDTLLVQKLDMSGKNVAFAGSGTVDTSTGQLNLTLTARGKRLATARPGVLESLAEGLGGAVVRMEVTGKADNPSVTTKTLPLIEDSLKILGSPR
ncbi:MAG: hypothetical protein JW955_03025 [Sedimentisphaerales bacterium]|nr:hypothetical protein [Sedimentisphaerales bacterium]